LLCTPVVLAVVLAWPRLYAHYIVWRLDRYDDTDLRKLPEDEKQRVDGWIAKVVGKPRTTWMFVPENRLLHSSVTQARTWRLYVVQMEPAYDSPGLSFCQIHTLDYWGQLKGSITFEIGKDNMPNTVAMDDVHNGFLCLTVETNCSRAGETARQFYRITDGYVELLRRERIDGDFAMGRGSWFDVRKKPPDWSDWARLLESSDRIQQLRGLAAFWCGDNLQHVGRPEEKTRLRLKELSKSTDPWISEESSCALKFLADRNENPALKRNGRQ